jgi:hypothetical protein
MLERNPLKTVGGAAVGLPTAGFGLNSLLSSKPTVGTYLDKGKELLTGIGKDIKDIDPKYLAAGAVGGSGLLAALLYKALSSRK